MLQTGIFLVHDFFHTRLRETQPGLLVEEALRYIEIFLFKFFPQISRMEEMCEIITGWEAEFFQASNFKKGDLYV